MIVTSGWFLLLLCRYWNSRLATERQRLLSGFTHSDVVCMFTLASTEILFLQIDFTIYYQSLLKLTIMFLLVDFAYSLVFSFLVFFVVMYGP